MPTTLSTLRHCRITQVEGDWGRIRSQGDQFAYARTPGLAVGMEVGFVEFKSRHAGVVVILAAPP